MSVYKEGWFAVSQLIQASKQVYPDAADFGVPYKKGDLFWGLVKQTADFYAVEGTRKVSSYATGKTASIEIELMDEGNWKAVPVRFLIEVVTSNYRSNSKFDGYITVSEAQK